MSKETPPVRADRPVTVRSEDLLGRDAFAERLVEHIVRLPVDESFVVALQGEWGSGKTSLLNLVANRVTEFEFTVVRFNPWFFSSQEQLVVRFFAELASQLTGAGRKKLKHVGEALASFADAISPLAQVVLPEPLISAGKHAAKLGQGAASRASRVPDGDVLAQKATVEDLLRTSKHRVLVMIDDLDRLEAAELREMFKLVRLVGDFPNVTYLLAFDRPSVTRILQPDDESEANRYLEKIVQLSFDVPAVDAVALTQMLMTQTEAVVRRHGDESFDVRRWSDCYNFFFRDLFRTPRDVRRYTLTLPFALEGLRGEVDTVDILVLEAMRVLRPAVFEQVVRSADVIAWNQVHTLGLSDTPKRIEEAVSAIASAAGRGEAAAREFCRLLFPMTAHTRSIAWIDGRSVAEWRRQKRVAHAEVLQIYLQRALPHGVVSSALLERVIANAEDPAVALRQVPDADLPGLYERLEHFEGHVAPDRIEPICLATMDAFGRLPRERVSILGHSGAMMLMRVLLRLLRAIEDDRLRAQVVQNLTTRSRSLSACHELVDLSKESLGLGTESVEGDLWSRLCARVTGASPKDLAAEPLLGHLLTGLVEREPETINWIRELARDDDFLLGLLGSALAAEIRLPGGSSFEERELVLRWGGLTDLLGAELLRTRVLELERQGPGREVDERAATALRLAGEYVRGTRIPRSRTDAGPRA